MPDPPVLVHVAGWIATITLNRPQKRNAINSEMSRAVAKLLDQLDEDANVRVVVLTGAGDRAFSAGADLAEIQAGRVDEIVGQAGGLCGLVRAPRRKPVVAAVNGVALAGGFELVLAADMAVAEEHAVFGLPEVQRGIIASSGGLLRLAERLPYCVAMELALTGRSIDALQAERWGLVNRVVRRGEGLTAAVELASDTSAAAPLAVQESRRVIADGARAADATAWEVNDQAWGRVVASADSREGSAAFLERRVPKWRGD